MARSNVDLPEWMEFGWPRVPEQSVPCLGSDPHHAGQPSFEIAKTNRPDQCQEISAERPDGHAVVWPRIYRQNEEDPGARKRGGYRLCNRSVFTCGCGSGHQIHNSIKRPTRKLKTQGCRLQSYHYLAGLVM